MKCDNKNMTSGKYFNKGVKALDAPHIGHVVRETPDAVVLWHTTISIQELELGIVSREVRTNNVRTGFEFIDLTTNDQVLVSLTGNILSKNT